MKYILSIICLLSLIFTPCSALNYKRDDILKISASVLGGACVGYIGGSLITKKLRGKDGKTGPQGIQGLQGSKGENGKHPFLVDQNALLNFDFEIIFESTPPEGTMVMPFVSTPDGLVFYGNSVDVSGLENLKLESILLQDPVFGTFHIGAKIIPSADFQPEYVLLVVNVVSTRKESTNTTIIEVRDYLQFLPTEKMQITGEFTYGEELPQA